MKEDFCHRKNSVSAAPRPSLSGIAGAIVVAETTVLAAATLASPAHDERQEEEEEEEEKQRDRQVQVGEEGGGTPVAEAASPSPDIQGGKLIHGSFDAKK